MYTSAKNSSGIDELFKKIGNQYFDPNNNINNIISGGNTHDNSVKLDNKEDKKKSKNESSGCCK